MNEMGNSLSRETMIDPNRQSNIIMQSPTMQQRMKVIGVPTALTLSSPLRRQVSYLNLLNNIENNFCLSLMISSGCDTQPLDIHTITYTIVFNSKKKVIEKT